MPHTKSVAAGSSTKEVFINIIDEYDVCHFRIRINCKKQHGKWDVDSQLLGPGTKKYPEGLIQNVKIADLVFAENNSSFIDENRDSGVLSVKDGGKYAVYYSKRDPIWFESQGAMIPDGYYVMDHRVIHPSATNFALFSIWAKNQSPEVSESILNEIISS